MSTAAELTILQNAAATRFRKMAGVVEVEVLAPMMRRVYFECRIEAARLMIRRMTEQAYAEIDRILGFGP